MKYRPDLLILLDILNSIDTNGVTISYISTYSNMPNPRVKNKLNQMIKSGLVEEFIDKNGKRLYRLTPKGVKTRNRIREMVLFLGELGLLPVDKDRLK